MAGLRSEANNSPISPQIDGTLSQGENIADNGGLKIARRAFEKVKSLHGIEPRLPGLDQYTNEQMFWLAYANVGCTKDTDQLLRSYIPRGYTPSFVRVKYAAMNQHRFAQDWNCAEGSTMNPTKRCRVW